MTRQVLVVAPDRPAGFRTIAEALRNAADGALITVAAGRYDENLAIDRVVTLAPEGEPGSVTVHGRTGAITVAVAADGVQLTGLVLIGTDDQLPVVQVQRGELAVDGCKIGGSAWAAVYAHTTGTLAVRDCEVANTAGAGIVVTSPGGNIVENTLITEVASSGIVVADRGRLLVRGVSVHRPGGNGLCVNGRGHAEVEQCEFVGCAKPALAVEQDAGATVTRVAVTSSGTLDAYFTGTGRIEAVDCSFTGSSGQGVHVAGACAAHLTGCQVVGAGRDAVFVAGTATPVFEDCVIRDTPSALLVDGGRPRFDRLAVTGSVRAAVRVQSGAGALFEGLTVEVDGGGLSVLAGASVSVRGGEITVGRGPAAQLEEAAKGDFARVGLTAAEGVGLLLGTGTRANLESCTLTGCGAVVGADALLAARDTGFSQRRPTPSAS